MLASICMWCVCMCMSSSLLSHTYVRTVYVGIGSGVGVEVGSTYAYVRMRPWAQGVHRGMLAAIDCRCFLMAAQSVQ